MLEDPDALAAERHFHETLLVARDDKRVTFEEMLALVNARVDELTDKYTRRIRHERDVLQEKVAVLEERVVELQDSLATKQQHLNTSTRLNDDHYAELSRWREHVFKLGFPRGSFTDDLMRAWLNEHLTSEHLDEKALGIKNPDSRRQKMEKELAAYADKVSTPVLRLVALRDYRKALLRPYLLRISDLEKELQAANTYAPNDLVRTARKVEVLEAELKKERASHTKIMSGYHTWFGKYLPAEVGSNEELRERMDAYIEMLKMTRAESADQRISELTAELATERSARAEALQAWRLWCLRYLGHKECTHEELRSRMAYIIENLSRQIGEGPRSDAPSPEITLDERSGLLRAEGNWKDWEKSDGKNWTPSMMFSVVQNDLPLLLTLLRRICPTAFDPKLLNDSQLAEIANKALALHVDDADKATELVTVRKALVLLRDALQGRGEDG